MDLLNAKIIIRPERLNYPLATIEARQGHGLVAKITNAPADVTGVFFRIFKKDGAYFDISANEHMDGTWTVRIKGVCFPDVGQFSYEIHAKGCDDDPIALGAGVLNISPFSITNEAVEPGTQQVVAEIPCKGGGVVQTVMEWDGYEWVLSAIHNEEKV